MPRPPNPLRDEVIQNIRRLTTEHGMKEGIRLARQRFPDVPDGSWGRWRQQAVGHASGNDGAKTEERAALAAEIKKSIPAPTKIIAPPGEEIPAARRALDFWRMLDELSEDANLLREFALTTGPDGKRKVKVPFALRDAHRMRCDLIRLALQHSEVVWTTHRIREQHDAVFEEIAAVDPEVQRRIIDRLRRRAKEFEQRGF